MVRHQVQFVLRFGRFDEFHGLLGQLLTIEQSRGSALVIDATIPLQLVFWTY